MFGQNCYILIDSNGTIAILWVRTCQNVLRVALRIILLWVIIRNRKVCDLRCRLPEFAAGKSDMKMTNAQKNYSSV